MRAVAVLVLLALCGCRTSAPTRPSPTPATECGFVAADGGNKHYVDWIDREVEFAYPPERIVSLAPNLTETLFAVGAGDQVVGVTKFCDYPPEAKQLPNVGGFTDVSPEAVLGLKADLVLATADTSTRKRFDAIVAAGQPAYAVLPQDLSAIRKMIQCVGEVTGHSEQALVVTQNMLEVEAATRERVKGRSEPRTLVILQVQPLIAAGPDTFLDELVAVAGGKNIAADAPVSWPRLDREWVMTQDPEVILTTYADGLGAINKVLAGTSAVESGRVHGLDPALVERPGPRIAIGLTRIADVLHPETKR